MVLSHTLSVYHLFGFQKLLGYTLFESCFVLEVESIEKTVSFRNNNIWLFLKPLFNRHFSHSIQPFFNSSGGILKMFVIRLFKGYAHQSILSLKRS